MSRFIKVRRYKRGTTWPDGQAVTCTRCRADRSRQRAKRATVTAVRVANGYRLPVGYCDDHLPEEIA